MTPHRLVFRSAALVVSLLAAPVARADVVPFGEAAIRFEAPPGQCRLSPSEGHFDDLALQMLREQLRQTATVLAAFMECRPLRRARRYRPSDGAEMAVLLVEDGPEGPARVFDTTRADFLASLTEESLVAQLLSDQATNLAYARVMSPKLRLSTVRPVRLAARDDAAVYVSTRGRLGIPGDRVTFDAVASITLVHGYRVRLDWSVDNPDDRTPDRLLADQQAYMASLAALNGPEAAAAVPNPADQPQAVAARSGDAGTPDTGIGFDVGRALTSLLMGAALVGAGLLLVALFRRLRAG